LGSSGLHRRRLCCGLLILHPRVEIRAAHRPIAALASNMGDVPFVPHFSPPYTLPQLVSLEGSTGRRPGLDLVFSARCACDHPEGGSRSFWPRPPRKRRRGGRSSPARLFVLADPARPMRRWDGPEHHCTERPEGGGLRHHRSLPRRDRPSRALVANRVATRPAATSFRLHFPLLRAGSDRSRLDRHRCESA